MTRTLGLLTLLLTLLVSACSQTPQDVRAPLEPQFGTAANDQAVDVAVQKRLGHVYTAGNFGDRGFLRRYTRGGSLVWERLTSPRSGYAARVLATDVDGNGNVYLAYTYYKKEDGYLGSPAADGPFISKLNQGGGLVWRKAFANLADMDVDGAGNLYLSGVNSVRKHNADGTLAWARSSSERDATMTGIVVAPSGNVVAASDNGMLVKYSNSGTSIWRQPGVFTHNCYTPRVAFGVDEEIYLACSELADDYAVPYIAISKFNRNGEEEGDFGGSKDYFVSSIVLTPRLDVDSQGNVYLTGNYEGEDVESCSGTEDSSCTESTAIVRKYARNGTVLWTRLFGTAKFDTGTAVALYSDNELYTVGYSDGKLTTDYAGASDAFLRKMDGNGNRIWTR